MCRWMAHAGDPILDDDLLFRPKHSLIDQSTHSQIGATTTNGDGFGIGWYGDNAALPCSRGLSRPAMTGTRVKSPPRSVPGSSSRTSARPPVRRFSEATATPFRYDRSLWMHNGAITDFQAIKRTWS